MDVEVQAIDVESGNEEEPDDVNIEEDSKWDDLKTDTEDDDNEFSTSLVMMVVRMVVGWMTKMIIIKFITIKWLCAYVTSIHWIRNVCIELNEMYD